MSTTLPDCVKCGNTRKIQSGYMSRDCVCSRPRITKPKAPEIESESPIDSQPAETVNVGETEKKKDVKDDHRARIETPSTETLCAAEPSKPTSVPAEAPRAASEPTDIKTAQPKRSKRKTDVAYKLGREMGYPDRVIEAIMCEKDYSGNTLDGRNAYEQWEGKYADIYLHPLATALPAGYDPTKWIPGEKARDAFRFQVLQNLPNKARKVNFDDLCDTNTEVDDEPVANTVAQ